MLSDISRQNKEKNRLIILPPERNTCKYSPYTHIRPEYYSVRSTVAREVIPVCKCMRQCDYIIKTKNPFKIKTILSPHPHSVLLSP